MFKEIKARFQVSLTTENGKKWEKEVVIERQESGAFNYGDHSAHSIYLGGAWYQTFDTRYDRISTDKTKWLKFWEKWLVDNWGHNKDFAFKLIGYEEKEVEDNA